MRHRYLIPNELKAAAAALALALVRAAAIGPDAGAFALLWAVGRALIIALPLLGLMARYRALRGPEGLGLGGVKLAAVAGARLGLPALFAALEPAALTAIGAYVLSAPIKRRPLKSTAFLPFGTYLALSGSAGWRRRCGVSAPERAPVQARACLRDLAARHLVPLPPSTK